MSLRCCCLLCFCWKYAIRQGADTRVIKHGHRHNIQNLFVKLLFVFQLVQVSLMKLRKMFLVRQQLDSKRFENLCFSLFWMYHLFQQSTVLPQWERSRSRYGNGLKANGQVSVNHSNSTTHFYTKKTEVRFQVREIRSIREIVQAPHSGRQFLLHALYLSLSFNQMALDLCAVIRNSMKK